MRYSIIIKILEPGIISLDDSYIYLGEIQKTQLSFEY